MYKNFLTFISSIFMKYIHIMKYMSIFKNERARPSLFNYSKWTLAKFPHPVVFRNGQIPDQRSRVNNQFPLGCPPPPTLGLNIDRCIDNSE